MSAQIIDGKAIAAQLRQEIKQRIEARVAKGKRVPGLAVILVGNFLQAIVNFVVIALAVFLVVRSYNRLQKAEEEAPAEPTTKECPYCLSTIPIQATRCPHCTSELETA